MFNQNRGAFNSMMTKNAKFKSYCFPESVIDHEDSHHYLEHTKWISSQLLLNMFHYNRTRIKIYPLFRRKKKRWWLKQKLLGMVTIYNSSEITIAIKIFQHAREKNLSTSISDFRWGHDFVVFPLIFIFKILPLCSTMIEFSWRILYICFIYRLYIA